MPPTKKKQSCTHPPDKREFVMDGYFINENGDITDTVKEKQYCTERGHLIPEDIKEKIVY